MLLIILKCFLELKFNNKNNKWNCYCNGEKINVINSNNKFPNLEELFFDEGKGITKISNEYFKKM
jgi:hypothetical protein